MNKRFIIVRVKGGLGNQMFQYAAGRALAIRNGARLMLDTISGFATDRVYRRTFSLGALPIQAEQAGVLKMLPFWLQRGRRINRSGKLPTIDNRSLATVIYESDSRFLNEVAAHRVEKNTWLEGYWQSEKYFEDSRDEISRELALPTPTEPNFLSMARVIESCDSVAVGVRVFEEVPGGDKSGVGGITPFSFYRDAAILLADTVKKPIFFVFCTTMAAVKNKLRLPGESYYITHDNGFDGALQRLWLISRCKHHIISNSSFYWWGAWLSEFENSGNTIIACDLFPNRDTIPSRWVPLEYECC